MLSKPCWLHPHLSGHLAKCPLTLRALFSPGCPVPLSAVPQGRLGRNGQQHSLNPAHSPTSLLFVVATGLGSTGQDAWRSASLWARRVLSQEAPELFWTTAGAADWKPPDRCLVGRKKGKRSQRPRCTGSRSSWGEEHIPQRGRVEMWKRPKDKRELLRKADPRVPAPSVSSCSWRSVWPRDQVGATSGRCSCERWFPHLPWAKPVSPGRISLESSVPLPPLTSTILLPCLTCSQQEEPPRLLPLLCLKPMACLVSM
ncbi:uncharacterized protein LOC115291167 [Suricata suricatta]|uniref:uncharacterized protein LOC115291167 n=1 Tax=Suricata suricatta TaxID=37032 RepID=UPI001155E92D|nr:uncharacterized protein LOC115291167 [Suricata suricatta]